MLEGLKEFEGRIGANRYHGGERPDDCDFEIYGILLCKINSGSFASFFEKKAPYKIRDWYRRMYMSCKYKELHYSSN